MFLMTSVSTDSQTVKMETVLILSSLTNDNCTLLLLPVLIDNVTDKCLICNLFNCHIQLQENH